MSQAARAHDSWADDLHTPPRRRRRHVESWASAEDLEVLSGLGRDPSATWTVLTLDRDDPEPTSDTDWVAQEGDDGVDAHRWADSDPDGWADSEFADATWGDEHDPPRRRTLRFRRSGVAAPPEATADRTMPLRLVDQEAAPIDYVSEPPPPLLPGQRRTVVIRGHVPAPTAVAAPDRRRPASRTRDRVSHRPDRVALWAFVLGLMLILIAVLSAGGSA
jgi:hypothetical protein